MSVTSTWRGPEVSAAMRRNGSALVFRAAHLHRNEAIEMILQGQKSGRVYRRKGIVHRASAPGQPPATDLGRLIQSIAVKHEANSLTAFVIVGSRYGRMLEMGTRRMRARPFMLPSARNVRPAIDGMAARLSREG